MGIGMELGNYWDRDGTVMVLVDPREFPYLWEDAEHCFDEIYNVYFEKDDIPELVCTGKLQLWLFYRRHKVVFAGLTEVVRYPRAKVLTVVYAGGTDGLVCVPFMAIIEEWAKEQGCTHTVVQGRRGWCRLFAPMGYKPEMRAYIEKKLEA